MSSFSSVVSPELGQADNARHVMLDRRLPWLGDNFDDAECKSHTVLSTSLRHRMLRVHNSHCVSMTGRVSAWQILLATS